MIMETDPGHAVADFDDGFVLAEVPHDTPGSEGGGQDVLDLAIPAHARNLFCWLPYGHKK